MSKIIALVTVLSVLTGSCCSGALSVFASDNHHKNIVAQSADAHHNDHAQDHAHENSQDTHFGEPCDHSSLDCLQQIALNTASDKFPKPGVYAAKNEEQGLACSYSQDLQNCRYPAIYDRLTEAQTTKSPPILHLTGRFRL